MPLIPAGVDPKITDGIVLFRPFHEDKLYFALVYFNGNPEVGKHYIKDVDITQPMNDADRLTDVKSSLPDLISKGATFVFARVPRGVDLDYVRHKMALRNERYKSRTARGRVELYRTEVKHIPDLFFPGFDHVLAEVGSPKK